MDRRDKVIQSTDVDALGSKYSAYMAKYINDDLIPVFVRGIQKSERSRRTGSQFTPKLPLINRGTYIRCFAIDTLINKFLENGGAQIISLGAGSDSRPFHLLPKYHNLVYHEIDFVQSTKRKCQIIKENNLQDKIEWQVREEEEEEGAAEEIHTNRYHLHALDLRKLDTTSLLQGMIKDIPTLVLSECCLCYLPPDSSDNVLKWATEQFSDPNIVLYEPIGKDDQFGQVMLENLASRGISLPTLNKYSTLDKQRDRLLQYFNKAQCEDFDTIHHNWLTEQDMQRINSLEFLDEREELDLLLQHYCVAWATNNNYFT